jgi:hypothetical protein
MTKQATGNDKKEFKDEDWKNFRSFYVSVKGSTKIDLKAASYFG